MEIKDLCLIPFILFSLIFLDYVIRVNSRLIFFKEAALGFEPRITVLQTVALVHLAKPPVLLFQSLSSLYYHQKKGKARSFFTNKKGEVYTSPLIRLVKQHMKNLLQFFILNPLAPFPSWKVICLPHPEIL